MSLFSHVALKALLLAGLQAGLAQAQTLPASAADGQVQAPAPAAARKSRSQHQARLPQKPAATPVGDIHEQVLVRLRNGRVSEAHALLRERLRAAPQDLVACRLLASLLLDSGQQGEAIQVLAAGQAQAPQSTDIAQALARLQAEQGQYAVAVKTLERSAEHAQQDAAYLAFMAVLTAQAGRTAQAIPLYQQALQLLPEQGSWWLALAAAQHASQDKVGARNSYEMALNTPLDEGQRLQVRRALQQLAGTLP